jgi:hypothetical protein
MSEYEDERSKIVSFLRSIGTAKPSDFDELLSGPVDNVLQVFLSWRAYDESNYPYALGELVEEGVVEFWQDEEGTCFYKLKET